MAKIKLQYTRVVEEIIEIPNDKFEAIDRMSKDPDMPFDEWNAAVNFIIDVWEDTAQRIGPDFGERLGVYTLDDKAIAEY